MQKNPSLAFISILLVVGVFAGCKPPPPSESKPPAAYFQTPFQTESEFIVDAVVSDLAEQMFYAKFHRLPDKTCFSVKATEKPGFSPDAPAYQARIRLEPKRTELKLDVDVGGGIWSPAVYDGVATELAREIGLPASDSDTAQDTALLSALSDGAAETIERENQRLSAALEKDFTDPELHEEAALLLGAFLLRDHSGSFFEIRSPLSRMTAHLAMARFLRGRRAFGINGQMAGAILLTLIGDEAQALEQLDAIGTNAVAAGPMLRALRTRNTGDYRLLNPAADRSPVESVAWFSAMADYISTALAWQRLSDEEQQTIDFVRAANQESYSVEIGHQLLRVSIPLELREIGTVYELFHHEKLTRRKSVDALNELPERCFSGESGGNVHVRIIGWGQWADFLQRHLCHAVQQNFSFMQYKWGVPDEAKQFAQECDREFGRLRLYPFVRRFNCTDAKSYHQAVDDGFKVTVATPQWVPAQCWNFLCYDVNFAPPYRPNPNPHINEWHNPNPPPGTVYDLSPRLNHPSLIGRAGVVARFEKLHELAPYDCRISNFILKRKYRGSPNYEQAMGLYRAVLPYSVFALRSVARTVYDQPKRYEELLLRAAELNPACYYDLGDYLLDQHEEDQCADYIDKACAADPDAVRASNHAEWRVRYYLKRGQTDKARRIADEAAEVYSFVGLEAKAVFMEATTNYDQAFEWYSKIEERYDDSGPLLGFCARYQAKTGDSRFEPEARGRLKKLFPKGIENVALGDFTHAPGDGVLIRQENALVRSAGLKRGDVIVAVYGVRVHNFRQYGYCRELKTTPELDLIVWQGQAYIESKPNLVGHRFGVDFGDYIPR
jgi:tetratricopeptide (TPR) repeat protein